MAQQTPSALEPGRPPAPAEVRTTPPRSSRRRWVWLLILVIVAAAAYFEWPKIRQSMSTTPPGGAKAGAKGRGGGPIPVVTAKAQRGNIGVYFNGLGVVTPIYTVTVKSRVDGQLMRVLYNEGQIVHVDDLLLEIDPRPYQVQLTQAEGQLLKDQATLENAKVDLGRYQKLWSQNAIPQQQLATQQATVSQLEGNIKTDQGQIDAAKLNLIYCRVTSPITGRVGLRLVDPGNIVHASDSNGLLVITQMEPISVIFTIAEDQLQPVLQRMRAGQSLRVEAWDREVKTRIATGTLATLDNQIDQTTGTLKLRANFENKTDALYPNQFVNARLLVEQKHGVTLVPNAAIQRNTRTTYTWVVKPDSTVTVRTITLGTVEGDQSEITSGLTPGEVVVTDGVDKLQEKSRVTMRTPGDAAARKGGA